MIVLIAPENDIPNEIVIIHQLFEAGLEVYHLRKPSKNKTEYVAYINKIKPEYHNRIVIHHYHELVNSYGLRGIHFQEQKRIDALENGNGYFNNLQMLGKTMSSSFHDPKTLEECSFEFDYHLLSPVFTSISKKGYEGKGFKVSEIDKFIIGLGGITPETTEKALQLGYNGIGVLGGIWNANNPIKAFTTFQKTLEELKKRPY